VQVPGSAAREKASRPEASSVNEILWGAIEARARVDVYEMRRLELAPTTRAGWRDAKCANPLGKPRYGVYLESLGIGIPWDLGRDLSHLHQT
jgi:hypothetical protein